MKIKKNEKFRCNEEGLENFYNINDLKHLWNTIVDHDNFYDFECWIEEMLKMQIFVMNQAIADQFMEFLKNRNFDPVSIMEIMRKCEKNKIESLPELLYFLWDNDYIEIRRK